MLTKNALDLVNAFGFISKEEGELLQKYALKLPPKAVCVNIGAGVGTSAVCVLEIRPDLTETFYTVDIRNDDNPFGGLLNERNAFDKYEMPYPNQIHGDSKHIGKIWDKRKIDLLVIDGDHSLGGATGDILSWKPNLKKGALVFVHDYANKTWKDVVSAVDEHMLKNDEFELLEQKETYIIFKYIGKRKK